LGKSSGHAAGGTTPTANHHLPLPNGRLQAADLFGRSALVVYARQSHEQMAQMAPDARLLDDSRPEKIKLTLDSSQGSGVLEFDFARMGL